MTIVYNSNYEGTTPFSDSAYQVALGAAVSQSITIPGENTMQYQALFSYTYASNVFVCKNTAPTVPLGGTVEDQQYNEFRPEKRYVRGGDVLHFITPDTSAYVGVSLMKLQG